MSKSTHGISVTRNIDTKSATFKLINKASEEVVQTLTLQLKDVHEKCEIFVSLYGMTKIVQDRESGTDMLEKLNAYQECFDQTLKVGVMARERQGGGPTVRLEVEALAGLKKISVKQAQALLSKYSKEDREKILGSELVKKATEKLVAKIRKDLEGEDAATMFDDLLA